MQPSSGQRFFEKLVDAKHRREDQSGQIKLLCSALDQIRIVCTDNAGDSCNHAMALQFVRSVADAALANIKKVDRSEG